MTNLPVYRVHDAQGNLYGPADAATLRQWAREGRIIPGMSITEDGSTEWSEVSTHPIFAGIFGPAEPAPAAASTPGSGGYASADSNSVGYASASVGAQMNVLALISMIAGIASIVTSCACTLISFPLALAAIVMGIIALIQCRSDPDRYTGKAVAVAGIICGGADIVLAIAVMALSLGINLLGSRHI